MANVSIRNVRKIFGSTEVLHSVSVEIEDGEREWSAVTTRVGQARLALLLEGPPQGQPGEGIAVGALA